MSTSTAGGFYVTGGTLRQAGEPRFGAQRQRRGPGPEPSYVERKADKDLYEGLLRGEFCYVLTSRQMGKSSPMVHTAARLRAEGAAVVALDSDRMRGRARGFTLLELLVVIAVIAIVAAILFPVFAQAREKARQAQCISNMQQFAKAGLMYAQDYDEMWVPPFKWDQVHCGSLYYWDDLLQPYMKNRQLPLCPSWRGTIACAAAPNLTLDGKLKPYSYGINTVEQWDFYTPWIGKQVDHHGFRCYPYPRSDFGCSVSMAEVEDPVGTIWITDSTNTELWHEALFDYAPSRPSIDPGTQQPLDGGVAAFSRHNRGFNTVHGDGHVKWYKAGSTKPWMWTIEADGPP